MQVAYGWAGAEDLAHARVGAGQRGRAGVPGSLGDVLHAFGCGNGGRRQIAEGLQKCQCAVFAKTPRLQRIQREQAPGHAIGLQHATHAVVHGQRAVGCDQTIVGVGKWAVWLKAHGLAGGEQLSETGMFGHPEAPPQRVGHQTVNGDGAQPLAFEPHQGNGICRKQGAQCRQQPAKAFALGQILRQIRHQRDHGVENSGGCRNDTGCQKHRKFLLSL